MRATRQPLILKCGSDILGTLHDLRRDGRDRLIAKIEKGDSFPAYEPLLLRRWLTSLFNTKAPNSHFDKETKSHDFRLELLDAKDPIHNVIVYMLNNELIFDYQDILWTVQRPNHSHWFIQLHWALSARMPVGLQILALRKQCGTRRRDYKWRPGPYSSLRMPLLAVYDTTDKYHLAKVYAPFDGEYGCRRVAWKWAPGWQYRHTGEESYYPDTLLCPDCLARHPALPLGWRDR
jgi:hypothetical protein